MPIEEKMRKYPICDTDIWIKMCKIDMQEDLFDEYKKLFFSDVVIQELKNKAVDSPNNLKCGLDEYKLKKDNIYNLSMNGEYFNSKERKIAKRLFVLNGIYYENDAFSEREKNLGEKVSLIYASIHNLDIMLSDDKESKIYSKEIRRRFKTVKVINAIEFLKIRGKTEEEAKCLQDISSSSVNVEEVDKEAVDGRLSNLKHLKYALIKKKYI